MLPQLLRQHFFHILQHNSEILRFLLQKNVLEHKGNTAQRKGSDRMPRQAGTASVKAPKFRKEAELLDAMRRQDPDAMRELMDRSRRYV